MRKHRITLYPWNDDERNMGFDMYFDMFDCTVHREYLDVDRLHLRVTGSSTE